jgi:hypothetical protein
VKQAGKGAAKVGVSAAEKGMDQLLVTTLRNTSLKLAEKQLTRSVAEKLTARELVHWAATEALSDLNRAVREALVRSSTIEVTGPVRFLFTYSGVGRRSWKVLTGLEVRLFMRRDARVFIRVANVPKAVLGARMAGYLEDTAKNLLEGSVSESEPVKHDKEQVGGAVQTLPRGADQLEVWQKNVSAWWLLHASGRLDGARPAP